LQQEDVQLATFGRRLMSVADALVGYRQAMVAIQDPEVVRTSGKTHHPIVAFTGKEEDCAPGAVTLTGYASAPTTLVSFDGADGRSPRASLIADANDDLFGTTAAGNGTMFEITDSGFVTGPPPAVSADILWQNANGQASIWDMSGNTLVGGGPVSPNPGPSWHAVGTGDFNKDGQSDICGRTRPSARPRSGK
jgi:hypothetical protein